MSELLSKKTVLILGYGAIGSALASIFRTFNVLVETADPYNERADIREDILQNPAIIKSYDYTINTIPVHDPKLLGRLLVECVRSGTHYLDTNEDLKTGEFVRLIGSCQTETLFAPHCGLAPGLINILGGHLIRECRPELLELRVGALTRFVDNDINYVPTWSPAGIINQYTKPFEYVHSGVKQESESIFHQDTFYGQVVSELIDGFYLDGIRYESFPTSGGLGTLPEIIPSCSQIMYRSIRLPGHLSRMGEFFRKYRSNEERIAALDRYRSYEAEDYVLIIATARGSKPDQHRTVIMRANYNEFALLDGRPISAIQKCTAASVAAVLDLHMQGKIKSGFLHQHDIDWNDFKDSAFTKAVNYR